MAIKITGVTKEFHPTVKVLDEISVDFPIGKTSVIVGKNGSGKSTLINCIAGLLSFNSGCINISLSRNIQFELQSGKENLIAIDKRKKIGVIFQQKALWQQYKVMENITHPLINVHKMSVEAATERAKEYLELFKLESDHFKKYPTELSGGQQRKVAIARTLATEPDLLLIDELEANLDQTSLKLVLDVIGKKIIEKNKTLLIISHRIDLLEQFAPNIVLLDKGKVIETSSSIDELISKNYSPEISLFVRDAVDPASSKWYFANQCLETARKISSLNLNEIDEGQLFLDLGKEVSELVSKLDPAQPHLVLIATKTENEEKIEFRIKSAEKSVDFLLDGNEASKLDDIVFIKSADHSKVSYDFKTDYKTIITNEGGFIIEKAPKQYSSLIDMMFKTKGKGLKYQFKKGHKEIVGAYDIEIANLDTHPTDKNSYYEFSKQTKYVYLIACKIADEINGVISIDTYSDEKWSTFIMEQLMLIADMVAIAIKQHQIKKKN